MKKLVLLTVAFLLLPTVSFAAITHDSDSSFSCGSVSSCSHAISSSGGLTNGFLFACVLYSNGSVSPSANPTYNGSSMTTIAGASNAGANSGTYCYYIVNPSTSATLSVSNSGTAGTFFEWGFYNNVNPSSPIEGAATIALNSPNTSETINAFSTTNDWAIGSAGGQHGPSGCTAGCHVLNFQDWDSNGSVGTTGSYTMTQTFSGADEGVYWGLEAAATTNSTYDAGDGWFSLFF